MTYVWLWGPHSMDVRDKPGFWWRNGHCLCFIVEPRSRIEGFNHLYQTHGWACDIQQIVWGPHWGPQCVQGEDLVGAQGQSPQKLLCFTNEITYFSCLKIGFLNKNYFLRCIIMPTHRAYLDWLYISSTNCVVYLFLLFSTVIYGTMVNVTDNKEYPNVYYMHIYLMYIKMIYSTFAGEGDLWFEI